MWPHWVPGAYFPAALSWGMNAGVCPVTVLLGFRDFIHLNPSRYLSALAIVLPLPALLLLLTREPQSE